MSNLGYTYIPTMNIQLRSYETAARPVYEEKWALFQSGVMQCKSAAMPTISLEF